MGAPYHAGICTTCSTEVQGYLASVDIRVKRLGSLKASTLEHGHGRVYRRLVDTPLSYQLGSRCVGGWSR